MIVLFYWSFLYDIVSTDTLLQQLAAMALHSIICQDTLLMSFRAAMVQKKIP